MDYIKKILQQGAGFLPGEAEKFSIQSLIRKTIRISLETKKTKVQYHINLDNIPEVKSYYWLNLFIAISQVIENAFDAVESKNNGLIEITGNYDKKSRKVEILIVNNGEIIPKTIQTEIV